MKASALRRGLDGDQLVAADPVRRGRRWRAPPPRWARRAGSGPRPRRNRCRARSSSGTDGSWKRPYSRSRSGLAPCLGGKAWRMRLLLSRPSPPSPFPSSPRSPRAPAATTAAPPPTADDPFLWLEDVHGERAMAWVEEENARSLAVLKGDPRYEAFHQEALKIVNATDRIPDAGPDRDHGLQLLAGPDQRARPLAADDAGRATPPPRRPGRRCSTSTSCRRTKRPTGSGTAPTVRRRTIAAA